MSAATALLQHHPAPREALRRSVPLYVTSVLVTLTGIGAVGSNLTAEGWTPLWSGLVILGHLFSYMGRARGWSVSLFFWPVMLGGVALLLSLEVQGHPATALGSRLLDLQSDTVVSLLIATIAVVRCFTLFSNGALRFSPVPAITMLALTGSSNVNVEIPIFFTLLILGGSFLQVYAAHLERAAQRGRPLLPLGVQAVSVWLLALLAVAGGLVFPWVIQPMLGPLSPFFLPGMARLQGLLSFTQGDSRSASVGAGPITLSATPVYEVFTQDPGLIRTSVLTRYTGRGWTLGDPTVQVRVQATRDLGMQVQAGVIRRRMHEIVLPNNAPAVSPSGRAIQRTFRTVGPVSDGIPSSGPVLRLEYPQSYVDLRDTGAVVGNGHQQVGRNFTVESMYVEYPAEALRAAPPVPADFAELEPETLRLPLGTEPVQRLAAGLAASVPGQYDRIQTFIDYLGKTCTYTLEEAVTPRGEDAAAYFLFVTKRGACDLAATSLAVMCRAVGIPARVAVGYLSDEPLERGGGYLLRQLHSHMWVEAYFEGLGWVPFDPTPGLGELRQNPLQTAIYRLRNALGRFGSGGLDSVLLLLVLLFTITGAARAATRFLRSGRADSRRQPASGTAAEVQSIYAGAVARLGKRGWGRAPWMTPREYLQHLERAWGADAAQSTAALRALTAAYEAVRYAGAPAAPVLQETRAAATELSRRTPPGPRRRKAR